MARAIKGFVLVLVVAFMASFATEASAKSSKCKAQKCGKCHAQKCVKPCKQKCVKPCKAQKCRKCC